MKDNSELFPNIPNSYLCMKSDLLVRMYVPNFFKNFAARWRG